MMGRVKSDQGQLFYQFHPGDAVPEDHLVRKIDTADAIPDHSALSRARNARSAREMYFATCAGGASRRALRPVWLAAMALPLRCLGSPRQGLVHCELPAPCRPSA
jgi:hypothetical protein